jgi:hypothetical protein
VFEDAFRELRDLQRRAERLDGEHELTLDELFPDEFMLRNTEFPSFGALVEASGFTVETAEDFAAIPDHAWDQHIRLHSRFATWDEMQQVAAENWALRQLGLGQ